MPQQELVAAQIAANRAHRVDRAGVHTGSRFHDLASVLGSTVGESARSRSLSADTWGAYHCGWRPAL